MHGTQEQLDGYLRRDLDPAALAELDAHVANCLPCSMMVAEAGPCGLWPDDLGPDNNPDHFENREYYNFGCATQRNLAAMVDQPADLVQPRAETPA